jgi:hypothetical protein
MIAQHALERSDYLLLPPAPQEQSSALTSSAAPLLGQFCPRVFTQKGHFSQKSALKRSEIHALLWAYRGPRERKDVGPHMLHIHALERSDYYLQPPQMRILDSQAGYSQLISNSSR